MGGASAPRDVELRVTPDAECGSIGGSRDPRRLRRRCRLDRARRRLDATPRLRARCGRARATGVMPRCGSATTAACLRTIPARTSCSSATRCSSGFWCRRRCTRSRRRCLPPRPRPHTTQPCATPCSTSSCSAWARTATPRRSSPTHRASTCVDRLAVAAAPALDPFVERVTLTIPALAAAPHVVFLAVGADKAEAARRAFGEPPSPTHPGEPRALARRPDDRHPRHGGRLGARRSRPLASLRRGRPTALSAAEPLARRRGRGAHASARASLPTSKPTSRSWAPGSRGSGRPTPSHNAIRACGSRSSRPRSPATARPAETAASSRPASQARHASTTVAEGRPR